jgi:hypothetical protein
MRRSLLLLGLVLALAAAPGPGTSAPAVDAGTALRLDVPQLAERAALVLEGRVREARGVLSSTGLVETEYLLEVDRTLYGDHQPVRTLRVPGGVLPGGDGLLLPGMPRMLPGEDVLLFLTGPSAAGARMPVGLSQGKFRVETNLAGERRLTRRHGSLTTVGADGGLWDAAGAEVFDYAETLAEVHAALARRRPGVPLEEGPR